MHEVALDLLILLASIWVVAVTLRPLGLPTVMGELIVGVLLGPAVLGLIEPGEAITLLAEIGIFFLMFHAGVETQPVEFYDALKRSLGVAVVGAIVPFSVSFLLALKFGMTPVGATFVGLTMTATAVVITLKSLKDLGLANTRVARIIIASCVIDDMLTLVFFGLVIGLLSGGEFEPVVIPITIVKLVVFFAVSLWVGRYIYPRLTLPFRSEGGKGFTFVLAMAFALGLFAEAIGLHMILGAYVAGLFFEEDVAHPNLVMIVKDRAYSIAYSFLGPIFFISLGFSITFDISTSGIAFIAVLTVAVIIGQIVSAGGMALRMGLPAPEALTVGVGMCGRAEMAFILASLALAHGAINQGVFTQLIFVAFLLNLFTPLSLKGCAVMLEGRAVREADATSGIVQLEKFDSSPAQESQEGYLLRELPKLKDTVVIFGYGPEVDSLMVELDSRSIRTVIIEEDEDKVRRLQARGCRVVHASLSDQHFDLSPLVKARALIANSEDENDALLAVSARELGFEGPIVALIDNPNRRAPMLLAGATAVFTPSHVLAAAVAVRASARIGPRITGVQPLARLLEVAEIRIHDASPLVNKTLDDLRDLLGTGVHIVGQWADDALASPPKPDQPLQSGIILVAAGKPDSIERLGQAVRPVMQSGKIVVIGYGDVGSKLAEMLRDAGEEVSVVHGEEVAGVDIAGDIFDIDVLRRGGVDSARTVILACENDNATLFTAAVVREHAPDVPILACVDLVENLERIQKAGADFTLSVSQVAGQLLAYHVLGQMVSQQARIKLVKYDAGLLVDHHPFGAGIRKSTGCSVIAVERDGEVIMDIHSSLVLAPGDAIYLCGTADAFERFHERYSEPESE